MSIISKFKSFERYILTSDGNLQLTSERTNAKDIIFSNGTNLEDALNGMSIKLITEDDYNNLQTKDSSVLYLVYK